MPAGFGGGLPSQCVLQNSSLCESTKAFMKTSDEHAAATKYINILRKTMLLVDQTHSTVQSIFSRKIRYHNFRSAQVGGQTNSSQVNDRVRVSSLPES